jgi:hypothetical protein
VDLRLPVEGDSQKQRAGLFTSTAYLNDLTAPRAAPHAWSAHIASLWSELTEQKRLDYLSEDELAAVKRALVISAAYAALKEKRGAGDASHKRVFAEMDFDRDGSVTFEEFLRWHDTESTTVTTLPQLSDSQPVVDVAASVKTLTTDTGSHTSRRNATRIETVGYRKQRLSVTVNSPSNTQQTSMKAVLQAKYARTREDSSAAAAQEERRRRWLTGLPVLPPQMSNNRQARLNVQAELLRSIEAAKVLSTAAADADTIIAAIVSGVFTSYEQFGIRDIVAGRVLLKSLQNFTR